MNKSVYLCRYIAKKGADQPVHSLSGKLHKTIASSWSQTLKTCSHNKVHLQLYNICGRFLAITSTGRLGLCFLWFYVREHPKAQPTVVLVLKHLRSHSFKSHLTDWESLQETRSINDSMHRPKIKFIS